jgi:hypothetical protein
VGGAHLGCIHFEFILGPVCDNSLPASCQVAWENEVGMFSKFRSPILLPKKIWEIKILGVCVGGWVRFIEERSHLLLLCFSSSLFLPRIICLHSFLVANP